MPDVKEGDFYKTIEIGGRKLELRYGYYNPELERGRIEPMPIFPNFKKTPLFTIEGEAFVTADQDICEHFQPKQKISGENWCNDCVYLEKHEEFVGLCKCPHNREKTEID
jgi:hypothetical protein